MVNKHGRDSRRVAVDQDLLCKWGIIEGTWEWRGAVVEKRNENTQNARLKAD